MRHAVIAAALACAATACTRTHTVRGARPLPAPRVDRVVGAFQGAGLGIVGGAITGAVLGYTDGDDLCEADSFCILPFTAREKAILGGFYGGWLGALGGLVIGAIVGQRDVYEHAVPVIGATPTAGGATASASWRF